MRVRYIQALPVAVNKGLEQWLVVRDGLQDVPIVGHVADGPLAQPRTAQSEDVAGYTHTNTISQNNANNNNYYFFVISLAHKRLW